MSAFFLFYKKGTSLVELIAVIVIMGIIAGIAIPTTIAVINRQKRNAAKSSANNVYATAQQTLLEYSAGGETFDGVEPVTTGTGTSAVTTGYKTTTTALVNMGALDKDPFASAVTFELTIATNKVAPNGASWEINGVTLYWSTTNQEFTLTATSTD